MAKKHEGVPALKALEALRRIETGQLQVSFPTEKTAVMYVTKGIHVKQTWLSRREYAGGRIVFTWKSYWTYLRQGSWLVLKWQELPLWEVEYYFLNDFSFAELGLHQFDGIYHRLIYMQVKSLDHIMKLVDHQLVGYANFFAKFPKDDLSDLEKRLYKMGRIMKIIGDRQDSITPYYCGLEKTLKDHTAILDRIAKTDRATLTKYRHKAIEHLNDAILITVSDRYQCLPLYRRLSRARKSLGLAVSYLLKGDYRTAQKRVQAAIKNFPYPKAS